MYRQSMQICTAEASFFYLIIAAVCFRRTASISNPKTRGALRDIGREYLNQGHSLGPETRVLAAIPRTPRHDGAGIDLGRPHCQIGKAESADRLQVKKDPAAAVATR
jgi:hypothetical protein